MLSFVDLVKLLTHDIRLSCRCTGVLYEAAVCRLSPQRCTWLLLSSGCVPVLGVTAWQYRLSVGLLQTQLFSKRARQRFELSVAHPIMLGPVVNNCHLLGYKFLPEKPFLMKAGFGCIKLSVCGLACKRLFSG